MIYDRQILEVLSQVGDGGISVQMLAKHLYNMNCSLFTELDIDDLRRYVQLFLLRNSKSPDSVVERAGRRGFYRLNHCKSADAGQLRFDFTFTEPEVQADEAESIRPPAQEPTLGLFD